jgi:hypothetical protein
MGVGNNNTLEKTLTVSENGDSRVSFNMFLLENHVVSFKYAAKSECSRILALL